MTYCLGVDLGTTFVAAAVARPNGVEMCTLGDRSVVSPAVVHVGEDGTVVTGDAADRRSITDPDLVGREVKRRLGDPTPIMLGSVPHPVTALLGALLRDVWQKVVATEGGVPERTVMTHPANWGPFRRELFDEVPLTAGIDAPRMVTEPEAAAAYYAASGRMHDGEIVAVYDLGGGTFDATVVRKHPGGIEILGTPEGIERLGGVDFDEAILSHVDAAGGGALAELDRGDAQTAVALARLRQDCVLAKEALSLDAETVIPVFLPGRHFEVRLTRTEFEKMVRAPVESTIGALSRTVQSAGLRPTDLSAVMLVGGSSRIPLIAEMVSREFGRPAMADAHPKYAVASGAATIAAESSAAVTGRWGGFGPGGLALQAVGGPTVPPATNGAAPHGCGWGADASGPRRPLDVRAFAAAPPRSASGARPGIPRPAPPAAPPPGEASAFEPTEVLTLLPRPVPNLPSGPSRPRSPRPILLAAAAVVTASALALVYLLGPWRAPAAGTPGPAPQPTVQASATTPPPAPTTPPVASSAQPTVAGAFPVAAGPQSGAVMPGGKLAYVTSTGTKAISVVDLGTRTVVASIPIAAGPPVYVAFTPDGSHAYVSVFDEANKSGNAIVVVDTATRSVTATIPAERFPYAIAVSPDGRQVYVPNHDADLVSVIDTATNNVINKITVKPNPHSVAFSVDGRRAYVANHASNVVTVIDTKNGAILAEIPVGRSPHSIAMSPDGSRVYVVDYDADSVAVVNPAANTVVGTIPVQREPQSVKFAPDGRHAYVVNDGSNSVSVIDTATSTVTATLGVGQTPTDVFVAPDGRHAYVTNISSNDVTVLNIGG